MADQVDAALGDHALKDQLKAAYEEAQNVGPLPAAPQSSAPGSPDPNAIFSAEAQQQGSPTDTNALLALQQALGATGVDAGELEGLDLNALLGDVTQDDEEKMLTGSALVRQMFSVPESHAAEIQGLLQDGFGRKASEVLSLQQNLYQAGYLSKADASKLTPGWYDGATANAYAKLIFDARARGAQPLDIMRSRLGKALDPDIIEKEGLTPEAHQRLLSNSYKTVWGHVPPQGYLEKFSDFNPTEFESYEKSKESWQDSPIATAAQRDIGAQVNKWAKGTTTTDADRVIQSVTGGK
jgi:hypothetical protein